MFVYNRVQLINITTHIQAYPASKACVYKKLPTCIMIKYWDIRSLQTCEYMNNLEFQSKDRVTLDIVATFEEARRDYEICQTTLRVYRNLPRVF